MPVHQPGRVLLHHVPFKFVRERVVGHGRKGVDAAVALVPFIDFLITLVVFLLMSFSSSGELLAQKPSIVMPKAKNTAELTMDTPIIAIDDKVIMFDKLRVADTQSLIQANEIERIEPLIQNLKQIENNWNTLHPNDPFPRAVILQADEKIDFKVIKTIMFSVAQAGYNHINFAVNQVGD